MIVPVLPDVTDDATRNTSAAVSICPDAPQLCAVVFDPSVELDEVSYAIVVPAAGVAAIAEKVYAMPPVAATETVTVPPVVITDS